MDNWISIEQIVISGDINIIHCDTRDFHCLMREDFVDTSDGKNRQISRVFYKKEYQMPESEVKEFLLNLKNISGGDAGWRMLSFNGVDDGDWLKYIRLYRNPKNLNMFIVCNKDAKPILWQNCTAENLIEDTLNAH